MIWKELLKEQKEDDFDENEIDFSSWGTSTPVSQDDEENEEDEVENEPNLYTTAWYPQGRVGNPRGPQQAR